VTAVRISLLGTPSAESPGKPLQVTRRQVRALLYHLAEREERTAREALSFLFWPDEPEYRARRHLSSLLSHLRRALPEPNLLITTQEHVALHATRVWTDCRYFRTLTTSTSGQPLSLAALSQAVKLYRGPFLAGFSLPGCPEFEVWVSVQRRHWERRYLEALETLIQMQEAQGNLEDAIGHARRYLEVDELAEHIHRDLIRLHATAGDLRAASEQYERCAVLLERELGVSPLPETQAVYQAAQQGRVRAKSTAPSPNWTTLPSLSAPLVGRQEALRDLNQAYDDARAGRGRILLISGEAGIGKSRLIEEFVSNLGNGATPATGSGHETEQGISYGPLVEALQPHLDAKDPAVLDRASVRLAELAHLMPDLEERQSPTTPQTPVEPPRQQRVFQALTRSIISLSHQATNSGSLIVLCLDNLHWADMTTLSYLGYLGRHIAGAPVLVLAAYRPSELQPDALRGQLLRAGVLREISLGGLQQADILRLVRHLTGQESGIARLSRRLHRAVGGNPFFLLEIVRAMLETRVLEQEVSGWSSARVEDSAADLEFPIPSTVSDAIRGRLRRLDRRTEQVLETCAVLGYQFDHDLIWGTSGRSEEEVVDALDILLSRQIVTEANGEYRFIHDLTRSAVYADLSYGRRRLLHRRAGESLEELWPEKAVTLARHFERAEQPDKAVHYLHTAGNNAMLVAAPQEASAHLRRAVALLRTLPPSLERDEKERNLQLALGVSLQMATSHGTPAASVAHARARDLCRSLNDAEGLFRALGLLLMSHTTAGRHQEAGQIGVELLDAARQTGDPSAEMVAHWQIGVQRLIVGNLILAREHLEEAVARHRPNRHRHLIFRYGMSPGVVSLGALAFVLWALGYPERALDVSLDGIALADELAYPPGLAMAQVYACGAHGFCGDWAKVRELAEATLMISEEHGLPYWYTAGLVNRGRALVHQGNVEAGVISMRQGIDRSREMGAEAFTVLQFTMLAEACLEAGLVREGLSAAEEGLDIARRTGELFFAPEAWRLKGECLSKTGEQQTEGSVAVGTEAKAAYRRAMELARDQEARSLELRAAMSLCRSERSQGRSSNTDPLLMGLYHSFDEGHDTWDLRQARTLMGIP